MLGMELDCWLTIDFFTLKTEYLRLNSTHKVSLVNAVKIELTRLHARISVKLKRIFHAHFCLLCPRCPIRRLRCPSLSCPCHYPGGGNGSGTLILIRNVEKGFGRLVSRGVIEYSHGQNKRPSVHFVWEGEAQIERYWNIFLRSTMSKLRVDIIWLQNLSIYAGILMVGCKRVSAVDFQARGGEIFLKQLEKYFCKVWRNIDDWSPVKLGNMQVINPSAKSASIPGISLQILIRLQLHLGCSRGPSIHKGLICPFFFGTLHFFWEKEHFFFLKAVCQYYACKFMQKVSFDKKKSPLCPFWWEEWAIFYKDTFSPEKFPWPRLQRLDQLYNCKRERERERGV